MSKTLDIFIWIFPRKTSVKPSGKSWNILILQFRGLGEYNLRVFVPLDRPKNTSLYSKKQLSYRFVKKSLLYHFYSKFKYLTSIVAKKRRLNVYGMKKQKIGFNL